MSAPDAEVAGLRERLLKQATCIYIAAEPECADDVSDGLKKAVAMIDRLTAALAERDHALAWYGEQAEAMARYMSAKPPQEQGMLAIVAALALDAGKRAALRGKP